MTRTSAARSVGVGWALLELTAPLRLAAAATETNGPAAQMQIEVERRGLAILHDGLGALEQEFV